MNEAYFLHEVIKGYRQMIEHRYQYHNLQDKAGLPDTFDETRVAKFRSYFLEYIYPSPEKRSELNEAFENLNNYIHHPEKLLRLLVDSGKLMFKYGRHLPKILRAGLKAMRSFQQANHFEEQLVKGAIEYKMEPPFEEADLRELIGKLPRKEIDKFIESGLILFDTLNDRQLVYKIIDIIENLIKSMRKRPNIYGAEEVRALELGYELIVQGNHLFEELSEKEQAVIFDFIVAREREVLDEIFTPE